MAICVAVNLKDNVKLNIMLVSHAPIYANGTALIFKAKQQECLFLWYMIAVLLLSKIRLLSKIIK